MKVKNWLMRIVFLMFVMSVSAFSKDINSKERRHHRVKSSDIVSEEDYGKVNTKAEKIKSIDEQIEELMNKKHELELLKKRIRESKVDIEKKMPAGYKPKIALVLSGGGAKGAAHIGVLRTLEKYNVSVDYIVGTSVGSIIGAMYAVGYTPDEIEETILGLDFMSLFTNSEDRTLKSMSEKVSRTERPLKVTIDQNNEIHFPKGFVNGEYIYLELKKIFDKAQGIKDFDDLPIPYRAVTTNLNTGKETVIKSGDLAKATLMSMAIPSVIVPVENNGEYYVDGGVTNNFPIIEAIKEKADIIIAIDITSDSEIITDKSNVVSVVNKIATYQGDSNTKSQKKYADILVVPKVKNHNTLNFNALPALIKEGELAGESFSDVFNNIGDKEKYTAYRERAEKLGNTKIHVKNINISGGKYLGESTVKNLKPKKKELNVNDLNLWTQEIYNLSYINRVFYEIDGDTVDFNVKENRGYKVEAGLGYISDYGSVLNIDLNAPRFNKYTENYLFNFELSKYPKVMARNKSVLDIGDYELLGGYNMSYGLSPVFFYRDGDKVSSYRSTIFNAELGFGTSIYKDYLLGLSLGYKNISSSYDSGEKSNFKDDIMKNTGLAGLYILHDNMNKSFFPTKGNYSKITGFYGMSFDEHKEYTGYSYRFDGMVPLNRRFSAGVFLKGGKVDNSEIGDSYEELFKLGGIRDVQEGNRAIGFYGLPYSGLITDEFFIGGANLQYTLARNLYLLGKYNIITYDSSNLFYQENKDFGSDWRSGYGVGIGWDTFMGSIEAVFTNNIENNETLFNLYFGYTF